MMEKMKVAMYYNNNDVRLQKMKTPRIKKGEILVEVIASGICGSDVMEWYRIKKAPLVLGHEITGVIVKSRSKYKVGKRVFVAHHVPCEAVAEAIGLTAEQVERVYRDIDAKRSAARYLHQKPLLVDAVADMPA